MFTVLVMTTAAKPFSEEDRADAILSDSASYPPKVRMNRHGKRGLYDDIEEQDSEDISAPPPRIRINRHGKRGLFDNMEEQDFEGETAYDFNDARTMDLADSPQRLRMNRHGK